MLIANSGDDDPGRVGTALREHGFSLHVLVREDHDTWPDVVDASVVVSLGSSWSTYWPDVHDAVLAEQRLLAGVLESGRPVLGVCFGAQQLATILGAGVERAPLPEVGWHSVHPPRSESDTPLFLVEGPWLQWHFDRFTVPRGAALLAESDAGPQVFRWGRAVGVQFHPEATESIVSQWSQEEGEQELRAAGLDRDTLLADTRALEADAHRRCDALVEWFLAVTAQPHLQG